MLKRITIKYKIFLLAGVQLAIMLTMGAIAVIQMDKIGTELVDIAEEDIPLANMITTITELQLEQGILFERALFNAALSQQNVAGSLEHFHHIKSQWTGLEKKLQQEIKKAEIFVEKAIHIIHSEAGKAEFRHVLTVLTDVEKRYLDFTIQSEHILATASTANLTELAAEAVKVEELQDFVMHELIKLLSEIQKFTLEAALQAEHDEQSGIFWIIVSIAVSCVVGITLPYIISRSIITPINDLSARLAEIASGDGDLTVTLDERAKDETGDVARSFNKFLGVLRTLISDTKQQANDLGDASNIAMKVMQETVSNIEKQQAETEIVASAVKQMSSTTLEVAENTSHAAEMTNLVKNKVTEGRQEALETRTIIQQLSLEVSEASQVIKNLVEETNNIGNVLESIQGIAAQTNLLALNAAIEAARAGETGRGFAVVADEVRTLAQRTQISTVDIQELLVRLKTEASNAVTSMNKGTDSASICLKKSEKASKSFEDASNSIIEISDLNMQIATATGQQSVVAEEVSKNILIISDLADTTSKAAKSTSEANMLIAKQVTDLHNNLSIFKS